MEIVSLDKYYNTHNRKNTFLQTRIVYCYENGNSIKYSIFLPPSPWKYIFHDIKLAYITILKLYFQSKLISIILTSIFHIELYSKTIITLLSNGGIKRNFSVATTHWRPGPSTVIVFFFRINLIYSKSRINKLQTCKILSN